MGFCYKFQKDLKAELFEFLETANQYRNPAFCNVAEYERIRRGFRMNEKLKKEFKDVCQQKIPNTITTDDDNNREDPIQAGGQVEIIDKTENETSTLDIASNMTCTNTIEDIVFAIKDNLEMEKNLNENVVLKLMECDDSKLEELFKILNEELNLEQILNLGNFVKDAGISENIISSFLDNLLLNKPHLQFNVNIRDVFKGISLNYASTVKRVVVDKLSSKSAEQAEHDIILRYVSDLCDEIKSDILGELVSICTRLNQHYIAAITILLNSTVKQQQIHILIENMSKNADEFNSDKAFGKLLIDIIKIPNKNIITTVEQPLRQLIHTHRSIWKGKLFKIFTQQFSINNDSTFYTQSITCG